MGVVIRATTLPSHWISELRRKLLVMSIIMQFVNFWNKVQSRPNSDLVKIAMMNCELASQSSRKLFFGAGLLLVSSVILDIICVSHCVLGDNQIDTDKLYESL